MEKLKTATGKEFACDYFNPNHYIGDVDIRILNSSFAEVATVFSDPKETVQLWCEGEYLSNHTKLVAIVNEGDAIRVTLGKE